MNSLKQKNKLAVKYNSIRIPGTDKIIEFEQKGLPVSQEALFLLDFIKQEKISPAIGAADLGCGSGLLTLGLGQLFDEIPVTGYEIQKELAQTAQRNIDHHNLSNRLKIVCGDIRDKHSRPEDQTCDLVICNPPFRKIDTGKVSPNKLIRQANHEFAGNLNDFIKAASISLVHKGFLAVVMIPERFSELIFLMEKRKVPPFIIKWIHHKTVSPANAVLVIGRKGTQSCMSVSPPLIVEAHDT